MTRHCFTYGSLMCEDIMAAVAGCPLRREPAALPGFARHPVRGETYPGIRPEKGGSVKGVLYRDLPPSAFERLDVFEGDQYSREAVTLTLADGRRVRADTYVFKPAFAHLLEPGDWDFEGFLREGKQRFEARYMGFNRF